MKKARRKQDRDLIISDGTKGRGNFDAEDYAVFISNGMTNNEKIEASEYYERFLNDK